MENVKKGLCAAEAHILRIKGEVKMDCKDYVQNERVEILTKPEDTSISKVKEFASNAGEFVKDNAVPILATVGGALILITAINNGSLGSITRMSIKEGRKIANNAAKTTLKAVKFGIKEGRKLR